MAVEAGLAAGVGEEAPVRRPWCVWLAVGLVLLGLAFNTFYLFHNCPIDLSGDEAHYWEWSRHLDYGYYSKPPGIAWVIAATIRIGTALGITGDGSGAALMPVMHMAAVLFGTCSGLISLLLARRIFRDDRAALAVIVLSAAVPMFAVGGLLITIDSPMYLCWAATAYCLWRAIEKSETTSHGSRLTSHGSRGTAWLYAAGFACAVGMLFKPVLIAIPICAAIAAIYDPAIRQALKTRHAIGALLLMLSSQIPVIVWNAHHHWVTFLHIITQGGLAGQGDAAPISNSIPKSLAAKLLLDPISRFGLYLGGQAGGMGGLLFLLLVIAVVVVIQEVRKAHPQAELTPVTITTRTSWVFLLSFTLPLWGFYLVMNLWKGTELNWPAASYFTGIILLAGIVTRYWNAPPGRLRRDWRGWTTAAVIWGILLTTGAMNLHRFYPLVQTKLAPLAGTPAYDSSFWNPRKWDPSAGKLRGMAQQAQAIEKIRQQIAARTGQDPLIITGRYDISSSLSFYLPDHPFVYCIMSSVGGRQNQYDLWPGLNQKDPSSGNYLFAGRPAILVGDFPPAAVEKILKTTFDRIEGPQRIPITVEGVVIRQITIYRGYGFRELPAAKGKTY